MTDNFVAVDVETANDDRRSICQIGLAGYVDGAFAWEWSTLVNPEADFGSIQIGIHGIKYEHVRLAPKWPEVLGMISESIHGQILASHTAFDCEALHGASQRYGLSISPTSWLDTCTVARHAWPNLTDHKLHTVCQHLGIALERHHDAGSDAKACGEILAHAMLGGSSSLSDWLEIAAIANPASIVAAPMAPSGRFSEDVVLDGNPAGPLFGHVVVATGSLSMGKVGLAEFASSLGCHIRSRVTRSTTILVEGSRNIQQFDGKAKSTKSRDAEELLARGSNISILSEAEFIAWARTFQE